MGRIHGRRRVLMSSPEKVGPPKDPPGRRSKWGFVASFRARTSPFPSTTPEAPSPLVNAKTPPLDTEPSPPSQPKGLDPYPLQSEIIGGRLQTLGAQSLSSEILKTVKEFTKVTWGFQVKERGPNQ